MEVEAQSSAGKKCSQTHHQTPMNHVEAARPRAEFFLMFAACVGIIRDVLVNVMSNRCQTCSAVAHLHQSLRKIFARLIAGSCFGSSGEFDQSPK